jgi:hypothetical protein
MKESCGGHDDAVRCYDMTSFIKDETHPAYDRKQRTGVRVPSARLTLKLVIQVLVQASPPFEHRRLPSKSLSQLDGLLLGEGTQICSTGQLMLTHTRQ